ncbi:hypothetical protein LINPERHAP1_LOCUS30424, partial [Linum perenne]
SRRLSLFSHSRLLPLTPTSLLEQKGAGGEHSSHRRPALSPPLSLSPPSLSLVQQKGSRDGTTPRSAHGGGGGSESDAVTISPSPPLRLSRRRQETQTCNPKDEIRRRG